MKVRTGFVSNSSSSSFVILLDRVTGKQVKQIQAHQIKGEKMGIPFADSDPWTIEVTDSVVRGWTFMDNFDMREFLQRIGVPDADIVWDDDHYWNSPFSDK